MTKRDRKDTSSSKTDTTSDSQDLLDSLMTIMESQEQVSSELAKKRRLLLDALRNDMNEQAQADSQSRTSVAAPRTPELYSEEPYDEEAEARAFQQHVLQGVQVGRQAQKKRGS